MEENTTPGQPRSENADTSSLATSTSGWVTTEVAARAIRVSPRTIRRLIERGELEAKPQGGGIKRTWLVSVDSLHKLRASRPAEDVSLQDVRGESEIASTLADVLREMSVRLEKRTAEAVEMRTRLELTEKTQSTAEEEAKRLSQENERLRAELVAERSSKGFIRRRGRRFFRKLFGG